MSGTYIHNLRQQGTARGPRRSRTQTRRLSRQQELRAEPDPQRNARFLDDLTSALSEITPPPPSDAECRASNIESEETSRKALLLYGVRPCYPSGLDLYNESDRTEYDEIIAYWRSLSRLPDLVLTTQRKDWDDFQKKQGDSGTTMLQRWDNFYHYHDKKHKAKLKELNAERKINSEREEAIKRGPTFVWHDFMNPGDRWIGRNSNGRFTFFENGRKGGTVGPVLTSPSREYLGGPQATRLEICERQVELEGSMLKWIKERREEMTNDQNNQSVTRRVRGQQSRTFKSASATCQRPNKQTRSCLSPRRSAISKPSRRKNSLRQIHHRTREAQAVNIATASSTGHKVEAASIQETKPAQAKTSPHLHRARPRKITKPTKTATRMNAAYMDSRSSTQLLHGMGRAQPKRQRPLPQLEPRVITTKSGRESKRPERFGFLSSR